MEEGERSWASPIWQEIGTVDEEKIAVALGAMLVLATGIVRMRLLITIVFPPILPKESRVPTGSPKTKPRKTDRVRGNAQ